MFHMSQYWDGSKRWGQCRNCGHWQLEQAQQGLKIPPKVLYFDIERSLMTIYGYELAVKSGYINKQMIRDEAFIICWAASWIGGTAVKSACVTQQEALKGDDRRVIAELFDLVDRADIVCGHNIHRFDWKHINTRFLKYGMGEPVAKYATDTYKVAKKHFSFESNSLDYILKFLGEEKKQDMNIHDWIDIVKTGNPRTLRKALTYCKHDVRQGIRVFDAFDKHLQSGGRPVTPLTTI